tara:strand:+ start:1451 stop:2383 length:933 start_codon:yes stop_codon:yes gene_type:complete
MFLKHLINPRPTIILFFIVFCIVFICLPLLNSPFGLVFSHQWLPPVFVFLFGLLVPAFNALGINNLVYEKNIIRKDNLVLGFVFLLLCTPFVNTVSEWIISFFLLFFLNSILETYQKEYPFAQFFNSGFLLSIYSFTFPNLLFLMLLILISGINYSNLNWRNLCISCIGIIVPYFFYFVYIFMFDKIFIYPNFEKLQLISFTDINDLRMPKLIWLTILLIISLLSFIELSQWLYKKSIRARKSFLIIFFYFVFSLLLIIFGGLKSWYFLMTPLCVIIGNYFTHTKNKKIGNLLFLLFITSSFYCRYSVVF